MGNLLALSPLMGYSVSIKSGVLKTDLDGGAARYRNDQIGVVSLVNVTWQGERQEYIYFRAFYRAATHNGAAPFDIYLKLDSAASALYSDVHFIPGSLKLLKAKGQIYTVGAQLAVLLE